MNSFVSLVWRASTALLFLPIQVHGQVPLSFEENLGQVNAKVKFQSRVRGAGLLLTPIEAVFTVTTNPSALPARSPSDEMGSDELKGHRRDPSVSFVMKWLGATPTPRISGEDRLPGIANYFIGNEPSKWVTSIPTYQSIKYSGLYPGIDLVFHGNQRQLEYDFVVSPHVDPKSVRLTFEGADALEVNKSGDLILHVKGAEVALRRPRAYQESDVGRDEVPASYLILGDALAENASARRRLRKRGREQVAFRLGRYDKRRALVIDPVLVYSTYLGGSGNDNGGGIAVDTSGNAYVVGYTHSANFPTQGSFQAGNGAGGDAFVTKLNAAGSALVYSTYLGGSNTDNGLGIAVDSSGNAYVTGVTASTNFPTQNPFQVGCGGGCTTGGDAFVTKLNATGSALVYSTYLGGSKTDYGSAIAVDGAGSAYVTGYSASTNFPTQSPFQISCGGTCSASDAFVTKLNPAGSGLTYSTYLGGSFADEGFGIAVDASGNAYLTGKTFSTDFPTASPFQTSCGGCTSFTDAFVAKLNGAGSALTYSSYLGGSGNDTGFGIVVDGSGSAYVTGATSSTDFPTASPVQAAYGGVGDGFITKVNAAGTTLIYSTYLGGSGSDTAYGVSVDGSGNAYVTGRTSSTDFPTMSPLQATYGGGNDDGFVTQLNAAGSALVSSTYLGGSGDDWGSAIAVDILGDTVITGYTNSTTFPTANAYQASAGGGGNSDAFVTKISGVATDGGVVPDGGSGGADGGMLDGGTGVETDAGGGPAAADAGSRGQDGGTGGGASGCGCQATGAGSAVALLLVALVGSFTRRDGATFE